MKLELCKNIEEVKIISDLNLTVEDKLVQIPIKIEFLSKKHSYFESIEIVLMDLTDKPKYIFNKSNVTIELPSFIKDNNDKIQEYNLVICLQDNQEYSLLVLFKIDGYVLKYKLNILLNKSKITKYSIKRINNCAWLPIVLSVFTVLSFIIYNLLNKDVYGVSWLSIPSLIALFISLFISFHGISYTSLVKITFKKRKPIKYLFLYPEIIIKPNYLAFFKSYVSKIVISLLTIIIFFVFYNYSPFSLPKNKNYSYFINDSLISTSKIYRTDIENVKIGFKGVDTLKPNNRIYFGYIKLDTMLFLFGKLNIAYRPFYFSKSVYSPIEDTIKIDTVLLNPNQKVNALIISTLKGNHNLNYHISELHKNCITFCSGNRCYSFKELVDDFFCRKEKLILNYLDKTYSSSSFNLVDSINNNLVNNFSNILVLYKFSNNKSKIDASEVMSVYNNIVDFKNRNDTIYPFYKGYTIETFTKLIQIYTILQSTKNQITVNQLGYDKIGADFMKYIIQDYARKGQYRGFKAKDSKILKMYAILIAFIQSTELQENYLPVFNSNIEEILRFSNSYEYELSKKMSLVEEQKRRTFMRFLFEEYARFNIPLNDETKKIFNSCKKDITSDPEMSIKLLYLIRQNQSNKDNNINEYINFLN